MPEFDEIPWWIYLLAITGLLAIVTGFVTLFFALGRRPQRMWTTAIDAVGSDSFLEPLAALLNAPVRDGGHATLLNNGDAFLTALLEDIAAARHNINFMVYIWEPGSMSDRIVAALLDRARHGLQVRVLLDGFGAFRGPGDDFDALRKAGVQIGVFRPLRIGQLLRFHRRNHRRAIVIDGRIGYTGGAAVGDKWLGDARNPDEWRDSMTRVTGSLTRHLQSTFAELWAFCTGEVMTGETVFPDSFDGDDSGIRSIGVSSSPSGEEHPLRLFYFLSFLAARERIWIAAPYFVPDKHVRNVVERRARAGVDVRILLPNEHSDAWPIRQASRSYYAELLAAGIRIFEYQPTMMHTKHVIIDGQWTVVGSANMDIRSKELNRENVLGIVDAEFAAQVERSFRNDLGRAREIRLEEWRRRGFGNRIMERFCVLFAEQY